MLLAVPRSVDGVVRGSPQSTDKVSLSNSFKLFSPGQPSVTSNQKTTSSATNPGKEDASNFITKTNDSRTLVRNVCTEVEKSEDNNLFKSSCSTKVVKSCDTILDKQKVPMVNDIKEVVTGRPWSKRSTIFARGPSITIGMVLRALNWLPVSLINCADRLVASYNSPLFDEAWKLCNSIFKLPQGFLQKHNTLDLIERCEERFLPRWPVCPGPLARLGNQLLVRPRAAHNLNNCHPSMLQVYNTVCDLGVPNYRGAKVPINPMCDRAKWSEYLRGYDDLQEIDFLTYGWPAGYESTNCPVLGLDNHSSSLSHPKEVQSYIDKEMNYKAICGPFKEPPFDWFRTNPLMVRPKKEEGKFRVILDLSFPCGMSVNSFIPRLSFDGAPYKLRLPTALDFAEIISSFGHGCYISKLDLSRAYRQLPCDPLDWPLLGLQWDGNYYIDCKVPFGLRHGAQYFERITTAVCYAAKQKFQAALEAYIDDMGGGTPGDLECAERQFKQVCSLIEDLGLLLALEK